MFSARISTGKLNLQGACRERDLEVGKLCADPSVEFMMVLWHIFSLQHGIWAGVVHAGNWARLLGGRLVIASWAGRVSRAHHTGARRIASQSRVVARRVCGGCVQVRRVRALNTSANEPVRPLVSSRGPNPSFEPGLPGSLALGSDPNLRTAHNSSCGELVATMARIALFLRGPQPLRNELLYAILVYRTLRNHITINYPRAHVSETVRRSTRRLARIVIRS